MIKDYSICQLNLSEQSYSMLNELEGQEILNQGDRIPKYYYCGRVTCPFKEDCEDSYFTKKYYLDGPIPRKDRYPKDCLEYQSSLNTIDEFSRKYFSSYFEGDSTDGDFNIFEKLAMTEAQIRLLGRALICISMSKSYECV